MGNIPIIGDLFPKAPEPPPPPPLPDIEAEKRKAEKEARKKARSRYGRDKTILTGDIELGEPMTQTPTLIGR